MPRVAVRVAYDGAAFAGSQRQPDRRTVEGEVLQGLVGMGAIEGAGQAGFQCASRTDKGVSAAGNVVAFDTGFRLDVLLPALGAATEDVWPHALATVPPDFDARRARARRYVYLLPAEGLDAALLDDALQRFVGTHDFRCFARLEPGVEPVRAVTRLAAEPAEGFWAVHVEGESFLWNQVRRMVSAAQRVARGEALLEDIARGLRGERVDLGTAPAEGLVLADVDHGLEWRGHPAAREAALAQVGERLGAAKLRGGVFGELRRSLKG